MIEIHQSRLQNTVNRLYHAMSGALGIVAAAATAAALGTPQYYVGAAVVLYFALMAAVTAWLFVFDRGPGTEPSHLVQVSDWGVRVFRRGDPAGEIAWADFADYRITLHPSRRIRLRRVRGWPVHIDYHALSPDQRDLLLTLLDDRRRMPRPGNVERHVPGEFRSRTRLER